MTDFNLEHNFDEFDVDIDMEAVERRTLKRAAEEMSEMVRQAVISEPDIISPGFNSPYGRGGDDRSEGPPMATSAAWIVEREGSAYVVKPHPKVRKRAIVLNYGYPGRITPNDADALQFEIEGTVRYFDSVEGPDATHFWEAARTTFNATNRLQDIAEEELEREANS